jgi:hypothetical protein
VFYVLWGIYHLPAANSVYKLAEGTSGMVQGRLLQNAFYILFFAISGIVIALAFNWRNDRQGYWMNGPLSIIRSASWENVLARRQYSPKAERYCKTLPSWA